MAAWPVLVSGKSGRERVAAEGAKMDYLVSWEMEVKAESPLEAAKIAREAQTRPNTRSTVFQVYGEDAQDAVRVDLTAIAEGDRA